MQAVREESNQTYEIDHSKLEGILNDIWEALRLLQDKVQEYESKQKHMAQDYGMLVRKPYIGYRSVSLLQKGNEKVHAQTPTSSKPTLCQRHVCRNAALARNIART